ncbi:MAG: lysylphosphatidylglycerol synthase transmembrane domain-containing protein [Anaerolineales bacterium]|nr:lysylphosphatidylglycerol synthase transmembrane domain-containing protein [Anaerolineales bacterium]
MNKRWQMSLGLMLSCVALAAILRGIRWGELGRAMAQANYWWLLPFVLFETLSLWARAMRWRVLLEEKIGGGRLFWITNISYFVSNLLPLRIGELARVYLATRGSAVSGMQALSTAVLERMIDVLTVFALLFAVLPLVPQQGLITAIAYWVVAAVLLAMVAVFGLARKRSGFVAIIGEFVGRVAPRLRGATSEAAENFLRSIDIVRGRRLGIAALWSVLVWLLAALAVYSMLLGFLPEQPVYVGVFVTAIVALGIALPSVPAGVGLWEAATVAALAVFGVDRETALAYAVVVHLTIFVKMAILGTVGLHFEGENLNHLASGARRFARRLRDQQDEVA